MPKLTAEVFNRPDCPEWAKYAFVNGAGVCILLEEEPYIDEDGCDCNRLTKKEFMEDWGVFEMIKGEYIERPAKALPDWVMECAVGYDSEQERYFEVTNIDEKFVDIEFLDDGNGATYSYGGIMTCSEARKRQFNEKEMQGLIGKIIDFPNHDRAVIVDYIHSTKNVYMKGYPYSASELFNEYFTIDGKPCFKLEHKNDKGEWVE